MPDRGRRSGTSGPLAGPALWLRRRRASIWLAHRRVRPGDVALASYPRSGNTYMRFLLAEILLEDPGWDEVDAAIPYVRRPRARPLRGLPGGGGIWKTHEPRRSEYRRAVYLLRDPREVAISRWHFHRWAYGEVPLYEFLAGEPPPLFGSWRDHVRSWTAADLDNEVLPVLYARLLADPAAELARTCRFLGLDHDPRTVASAAARVTRERVHEAERTVRPGRFEDADAGAGHSRIGGSGWRELLGPRELELLGPDLELWRRIVPELGAVLGR